MASQSLQLEELVVVVTDRFCKDFESLDKLGAYKRMQLLESYVSNLKHANSELYKVLKETCSDFGIESEKVWTTIDRNSQFVFKGDL